MCTLCTTSCIRFKHIEQDGICLRIRPRWFVELERTKPHCSKWRIIGTRLWQPAFGRNSQVMVWTRHHVPIQISAELQPSAEDYNDVGRRLLVQIENDGPDQLPPAIIQYFKEIVDFASNKFADLRQQLSHDEHHYSVLKGLRKKASFLIFCSSNLWT